MTMNIIDQYNQDKIQKEELFRNLALELHQIANTQTFSLFQNKLRSFLQQMEEFEDYLSDKIHKTISAQLQEKNNVNEAELLDMILNEVKNYMNNTSVFFDWEIGDEIYIYSVLGAYIIGEEKIGGLKLGKVVGISPNSDEVIVKSYGGELESISSGKVGKYFNLTKDERQRKATQESLKEKLEQWRK